jgi:hypothetical protein
MILLSLPRAAQATADSAIAEASGEQVSKDAVGGAL